MSEMFSYSSLLEGKHASRASTMTGILRRQGASVMASLLVSLGASVLVSLGASPAMAQEDTHPASARSLNGPDAIEAALAAHPGYRATLVEVRRARAHLRAEGARYVPTLHLEGGFQIGNTPSLTQTGVAFPYNESVNLAAEVNHTFDTGTNLAFRATGSRSFRRVVINIPGSSQVIPFGPGYGLDVTLTVTQPFLRGFGTNVGNAELRNAEAALVQAESTRSRRANELVRDTLQAYAELWYAEQAVVIDASSRDLAVRQRADAQGRIEVGVMSPADALSLATRVASLEELLAVAEADRRSRAMLLATLLGLPLGTELHATDDPPLLGFSVPDDRAVALSSHRCRRLYWSRPNALSFGLRSCCQRRCCRMRQPSSDRPREQPNGCFAEVQLSCCSSSQNRSSYRIG